ncbi:PREDICTED: uncharacterized protein LOC105971107 [Erythranthe guttata]|uniref:uncharacterized protein LOC105971107 n=1 Tax=Erythranthe guttata TaxID=4155 RepID=UPI00064DCCE0|nr:PREDICTED: uncharacterized protein LOC105971107 [Erythranthe guttata]|eukprot:XP_012851408.1 PREDICTED: uncharacterized protein LOC105971107 [Erythranthe guttata]
MKDSEKVSDYVLRVVWIVNQLQRNSSNDVESLKVNEIFGKLQVHEEKIERRNKGLEVEQTLQAKTNLADQPKYDGARFRGRGRGRCRGRVRGRGRGREGQFLNNNDDTKQENGPTRGRGRVHYAWECRNESNDEKTHYVEEMEKEVSEISLLVYEVPIDAKDSLCYLNSSTSNHIYESNKVEDSLVAELMEQLKQKSLELEVKDANNRKIKEQLK